MIETNRIEFKRELTRELDIEREVVAFLNYREGGTIYIGIDDNGHPVKINDIDDDMLKVKARIRNNILPSPMGLFDVQTETIEGTQVIKIVVASGSGIPRILRVYGEGCFHFTDNFIRITLPISQPQTATNGGQVGGTNGVVHGVVKLTDRQHIIMGLIRQFVVEHVVDGVVEDGVDKLSARVIAQKVKSSTRTIQRELAYLQEKGLIKYNGTDTKGYYEIVE